MREPSMMPLTSWLTVPPRVPETRETPASTMPYKVTLDWALQVTAAMPSTDSAKIFFMQISPRMTFRCVILKPGRTPSLGVLHPTHAQFP